ncbi:DEAD/DEAH box helicase [Bradyrhizobium yuanmingense]|uniref:helicase-related protein n=1 Tax=Bradyrhizobium yuanmingense TaxID=108015 RepID=UPI000FE32339|nr:DEAD/DEAH box helicase [Bradyrhizobium yuanmingense]TGN73461.1 DEAD/DEAH box helicase [Bradyrhizobium yuanmingense]
MSDPMLVKYNESLRAVLRRYSEFGYDTYDLVAPPKRLLGINQSGFLVESNVDGRRIDRVSLPTALLVNLPANETWTGLSNRTAAKLLATFLVASDPQRRLEARKAATLTHQVSLVQHILQSEKLRRVLIADEVGLGKTIEAGLLVKQVLEQDPRIRILYLAPARLVQNVAKEFREKLDLDARIWVAGSGSDARMQDDRLVIASIHKAIFDRNHQFVVDSGPWDFLIIDECHHLSDWGLEGGKPNRSYRLVNQLIQSIQPGGRLVLMSGTPHQGSDTRFKNLLRLLSEDGKPEGATGRIIYRTKERVRDWSGRPLFPPRDIRSATVVTLGDAYEEWYRSVGNLYEGVGRATALERASGWAKGQALQWAASSVDAGLAFLCRLAIRRLKWTTDDVSLKRALEALRPYRGGQKDESVALVFERMKKQIAGQIARDEESLEDEDIEADGWKPDSGKLAKLLDQGVMLIRSPAAAAKWSALERLLTDAGDEKVVLFAQPVETVAVVASFIEQRFSVKPAIIVGNQTEAERINQLNSFQSSYGPQFLVSSRAGGEGLNMQKARRLVHLDVPWNPMELEQRVGRIHRFGSRKTIVVDTLIVKGTREVDMYRIARERLRLIASQLDPEQFEVLFSRVMSLVPPAELDEILGDTDGAVSDEASESIGRLVKEGYDTWRQFDDAYRKDSDEIRNLSPGEASWADIGLFLTRFCGARPGPNSTVASFAFQNDEIVSSDEALPTLVLGQTLYACGDAGGHAVEPINGNPVLQLGMNLPDVMEHVRQSFLPDRPVGAGYFALKSDVIRASDRYGVLFFLVQSVRLEFGRASEEALDIRAFVVDEKLAAAELNQRQCAGLIRELATATRSREPAVSSLPEALAKAEFELACTLRQPTDEEVRDQVRRVVWPLAAIVCTPQ